MIGSGILLLPLLWLVISVLLLGFNHLVSDWLDYRRCRIKLRWISWDDAKGRRSICLHSACVRKISVVLYGWTVLPLFRLELLLQLQLRLQTILRYSSGIRYYTLDWAIVLFFLLVNCWLSQVLLYSRSSILKGLKGN
jgi:hypothetical protein